MSDIMKSMVLDGQQGGLLPGGTITVSPTTFTNEGALAASGGAAAAPQELHNARHAYTQASQGPIPNRRAESPAAASPARPE